MCTLATVSSGPQGPLNVMKALAGSSWCFTTETLVATYKAIVSPILSYAAPSGSPKYFPPIWTNLRWSRTKPWWSRPDAIERPRRPTSGRRLGSSPKEALRTLLPAVLCQRPPTPSPQSPNCHIPSRPPTSQGYPPGLIPPHTPRPASQRWRPQRPLPHLRGRAGRGRFPLGQTPPQGPDDRRDHPIPGTQQGAHSSIPLQLTQPNNFYHSHSAAPSLSSVPSIVPGFKPTVTL